MDFIFIKSLLYDSGWYAGYDIERLNVFRHNRSSPYDCTMANL